MHRGPLVSQVGRRFEVLHPGELAQVQMPFRAICHAKGFGFLLVGDGVQINFRRNNVDQDISTEERDESCAHLGSAKKFEPDGINGEEVSRYPRDSALVRFHRADEVTMGLLLEISSMNDVNLFAGGKNFIFHFGVREKLTYLLKHAAGVVAILSPAHQAITTMFYSDMALVRIALVLLLAGGAAHAQEVAELKARTGKPVIQELMGGCSLTCAFPWEAVAGGSSSDARVAALNDADSHTAWTDAHAGDTLVFTFPSNLPRELNGTPFYGIDIANGCLHPEIAFKAFGRIKTIRLYHNGHPLYMIHLADTRRWQHVTFSDVYLSIGDTLAIEVLDTYSGEEKRSTAVTEIVLQGAH